MKYIIKLLLITSMLTQLVDSALAKDLFFRNTERLSDLYMALSGEKKFLSPTRLQELERQKARGINTQYGADGKPITAKKPVVQLSDNEKKYANERGVKKPLELKNYYINSVIHNDSNNWTVWINGEYYDSQKSTDGIFNIIKASPNRIALLIENENIKFYDSYFNLKMLEHKSSDYWKYISADGRIVVNPQKGQIRVILDSRQQFVGWMMQILPHRDREKEEKKILHPLLEDKSEYKSAGKEYYRY